MNSCSYVLQTLFRNGVLILSKGKKNKASKLAKEIIEKEYECLCEKPRQEEEKLVDEQSGFSVLNLSDSFIYYVSDFFKVFGDPTRLRMLSLLADKELCVGDIAERLSMTQSAVSHQLRVLRQNDLVKYRKEGKTVFYSLDDEHVRMILEQGITHLQHKKMS